MTKYNLTERKEKVAAYRSLVSPQLMDELKGKDTQYHPYSATLQGQKLFSQAARRGLGDQYTLHLSRCKRALSHELYIICKQVPH